MSNKPSATDECHEPSGKCKGISQWLDSGYPEYMCYCHLSVAICHTNKYIINIYGLCFHR